MGSLTRVNRLMITKAASLVVFRELC